MRAIVLALVLQTVTFSVSAKAAPPVDATESDRSVVAAYLATLSSEHSRAEIDKLMEEDDNLILGSVKFSGLSIHPGQFCTQSVALMNPESITSNPGMARRVARAVRRSCLSQQGMDFRLNPAVSTNPEKARESFVCSVSSVQDAVASVSKKRLAGSEMTVYIHRPLWFDSEKNIDNRYEVTDVTPAVPGKVVFFCQINLRAFAEAGVVDTERSEWKAAKFAETTKLLNNLDERLATATGFLKTEIARLEKVSLRLNGNGVTYSQCLNSYRTLDRSFHLTNMEAVDYEVNRVNRERAPKLMCPTVVETVQARLSEFRVALASSDLRRIEAASKAAPLVGPKEEELCQKQIAICQRESVMGKLFDTATKHGVPAAKRAAKAVTELYRSATQN